MRASISSAARAPRPTSPLEQRVCELVDGAPCPCSIARREPETLAERVLMADEQRCFSRQLNRVDRLKSWVRFYELRIGQTQINPRSVAQFCLDHHHVARTM